jgi:hypothetical protein
VTGLIFNARTHTYTLNGQRVPGVTSILSRTINKPGLLEWYGKKGLHVARAESKAAADFGTRVHELVERINKGEGVYGPDGELAAEPDIRPFGEAYRAWFEGNVESVLAVEARVYSPVHFFAGTVDMALVLKDGRAVLADLKTSRLGNYPPKAHAEWRLQTVAYQVALLESMGIVTTGRIVVRLPSDKPGTLVVHELLAASARSDWSAFLACLQLYNWIDIVEQAPPRNVGKLATAPRARGGTPQGAKA